MSKQLKLLHGDFTVVDDIDFDFLYQWSWSSRINKSGNITVARGERRGGRKAKYNNIKMAREIAIRMNLDIEGLIVDHWDNDGLNNIRQNLRVASQQQNKANSRATSSTGYKGVSVRDNRIQAQIKVNYQMIHLGTFTTLKEAALAYNQAALFHFGPFARLNILD